MDQAPAAISTLQAGQNAAHHLHSSFTTAAVDDVHCRAGAVPSKQTSLAPGLHAQPPLDQAAPAVHNAVAQAGDRPAGHHAHSASPAAPDAVQPSASLRPGSTEQPDTSKEPVSLCFGKNNAIVAAARDGQQASSPVSVLRQHTRKRLSETASVCTASQADAAFPAPDRPHVVGKHKRRKPAPSFEPGATAGDVSADAVAAQKNQLTPTAIAEPSAEPASQPQLQQWVGHDPADQAHAALPGTHEALAPKTFQPDPQPELQSVPQAEHDAQPQAENQLEPESHERVSTQVLPPDSTHALLQSRLHSVPEAASLAVAPSAISRSQQQPQLWCCTWPHPVQQAPPQPEPPGQLEHEPKRRTRHEARVCPELQPDAVRFDCQGLTLLPTDAQLHCERLAASHVQGSASATVADYPDLFLGSVEGAHLAAEWRDASDARLSSYGNDSAKLMRFQCLDCTDSIFGCMNHTPAVHSRTVIPRFACACQCLSFWDGARRFAVQLPV